MTMTVQRKQGLERPPRDLLAFLRPSHLINSIRPPPSLLLPDVENIKQEDEPSHLFSSWRTNCRRDYLYYYSCKTNTTMEPLFTKKQNPEFQNFSKPSLSPSYLRANFWVWESKLTPSSSNTHLAFSLMILIKYSKLSLFPWLRNSVLIPWYIMTIDMESIQICLCISIRSTQKVKPYGKMIWIECALMPKGLRILWPIRPETLPRPFFLGY